MCVGVGPGVRDGFAGGVAVICRVSVAVGTAVSVAAIVGVGVWLGWVVAKAASGVGWNVLLVWQAASTAVPSPTINNNFA
ncbi:MAG: hypothetical protein IPM53_12450 [Anaerolineaceae bacterium]|nr:hypothetical protein [Anaerolineaceae bacterium]